jgi:hypothetical protein
VSASTAHLHRNPVAVRLRRTRVTYFGAAPIHARKQEQVMPRRVSSPRDSSLHWSRNPTVAVIAHTRKRARSAPLTELPVPQGTNRTQARICKTP